MVNKCCVPNCTSNYDSKKETGLVSCFTFPSKEELMKKVKEKQKIPHENLIISKHRVVCVKHFKEEDIIRNDILPGKNVDPDIIIPRKRIKLKADAVLLIFPNLSNYLSDSKKLSSRTSLSKRKRCFEEYQNAKQDEWISLDSIKSHQDFTNKISNWIKQFPDINIQVQSEYVLLYEISKFDF